MSFYPGYGAPPFSGAPPLPPGWNVNPQQWQAGRWQPNPAFNPHFSRHPAQPPAPWIPGQAWVQQQKQPQPQQHQPQQQQQQAYNPYKKTIKPPSAEYLATKLSDNPLGLTNMIPAEQLQGPNGAPQTPWIWNPRGLVEDESDPGEISADYVDEEGRFIAQEPRGPVPSRKENVSRAAESASSSTVYRSSASAQATRHSTEPIPSRPNDQRTASSSSNLTRHATEPILGRPSSSRPSSSATVRPLNQPVDRPRAYQTERQANGEPPTSDISGNRSSPTPQHSESYSSHQPLVTTFSNTIIRTPEHYEKRARSPPRSSNVKDSGRRGGSGTDGPMESLMDRMNRMNTSHSPEREHRSSQSPSSLFSGSSSNRDYALSNVPMFVDEPGTMLSPLTLDSPELPPARPLARHHTAPSMSSNSRPDESRSDIPPAVRHPPVTNLGQYAQVPQLRIPSSASRQAKYSSSASRSSVPPEQVPQPPIPPLRPSPQKTSPTSPQYYSASASAQKYSASASSSRNSVSTASSAASTPQWSSASAATPQYMSSASNSKQQQHTSPASQQQQQYPTPVSSKHQHTASASSSNYPSSASTPHYPSSASQQYTSSASASQQYTSSASQQYASTAYAQHPPSSYQDPSPTRRQSSSGGPSPKRASTSSSQQYSSPASSRDPSPVRRQSSSSGPSPKRASTSSSQHYTSASSHHREPSPARRQSSSDGRSPNYHSTSPSYITPPHSGSFSRNPLPPPPHFKLSTPLEELIPTREREPPHYRFRVRKGFWNRRGDYLTPDHRLVLAPPEEQYPKELSQYPSEDAGYINHDGVTVKYNPNRPLLPEAVSHGGREPILPYRSFIVYRYIV